MKQFGRVMITFSILVVIIIGLYGFSNWFSKTTGYVFGEDEKIKLAQCLTENEDVLFISDNCAECDNQLRIFGENAISFLSIVDCSGSEVCENLKRVPAWSINNEFYYGNKNLGELLELSNCEFD